MNSGNENKRHNFMPDAVFYLLVFAAITCFAMVQSYGDPPDEVNRFKVVSFICRHGRLPHGADPEVLLDGFGASYAFQPMLTYIIQGFLLRFLKLFTADGQVLLVAARMVNVLFGVLMAYFVRQTARLLWENTYLQWTFTVMTVFLPQNIFLHSYVNTDSMAMLAVSVICYGLLRARRSDYDRKDCVLLAAGIILCAMSYYNAYGIILAAMVVFALRYVHIGGQNGGAESVGAMPGGGPGAKKAGAMPGGRPGAESAGAMPGGGPGAEKTGAMPGGRPGAEKAAGSAMPSADRTGPARTGLWVEWRPLLRKGTFISAIVLLGIGWWFLRNGLLYGGDIIAMDARRECAVRTAAEAFNPLTRFTYQRAGIPLADMLFETDYIPLVLDSFIAMFGAMDLPTHGLIYLGYRYFWLAACAAALLVPRRLWNRTGSGSWSNQGSLPENGRKQRLLFNGGMALFCLITVCLSIYYSYTWDFQPQGRYILPVLIPFMCVVTLGVQKLCGLLESGLGRPSPLPGGKNSARENRRTGGSPADGREPAPRPVGTRQRMNRAKIGTILGKLLCIGIMAYVLAAFAYSLFGCVLPHYGQNHSLFTLFELSL